jgi:hypothetical protein
VDVREEVTEEGRESHKEELRHLHSSANTVRTIKLRRTRWAGIVACMEPVINETHFWSNT